MAVGAFLVILVGGGLLLSDPSLRARWQGVSLILRYREGQESRQRLTATWTGRHVVRGLPPGLASRLQGQNGRKVHARLDLATRIVVRSAAADGTAVLESTLESGMVEVGSWRMALPKSPVSVQRVDAWGRVLDEPGRSGLSLDQRRKFDAFLSSLVGGYLGRERRRVGQSWSQAVDLPLDEGSVQARITGSLDHVLEGLDTVDGAVLAAVGARQQIRGRLGPMGGSGGQGAVEARGDFQGTSRFLMDWTEGMLRRVEGRGEAHLTFQAVLPEVVTGRRQPVRVKGEASGKVVYTVDTVASKQARP